MTARRCILLFSRGASAEARAKGLASPSLFDLARRRYERIAKVIVVRAFDLLVEHDVVLSFP